MRSHVEGYDGFETDRPAYPGTERGPFIPHQAIPWLNGEHSVYCIQRSSRGISGRLYKGISWTCQHNSRSGSVPITVKTAALTRPRRVQDLYANGFTEFKPDKKLHWLPQLGTITLELELQDRTIEAEVTPLEAAVIGLFEENGAFLALSSVVCGI